MVPKNRISGYFADSARQENFISENEEKADPSHGSSGREAVFFILGLAIGFIATLIFLR